MLLDEEEDGDLAPDSKALENIPEEAADDDEGLPLDVNYPDDAEELIF